MPKVNTRGVFKMKKGYVAGKHTSFVPSSDADWIEDFNTMLTDSNMSRNAFTEMLIREAVRVRMGLAVSSPLVNSNAAVESTNIRKLDAKLNEILQAVKGISVQSTEPKAAEVINQLKANNIEQPEQEDPQDILMSRLQAISPK